jgi:hypothetical protein
MEVKYILEIRIGGKVDRGIVLPLVNRMNVSRIPTDVLTWTLGDEPLIEHSGVKEYQITLMGDSGQRFRLGTDHQGNRVFDSGPELFKQFDRFLHYYAKTAHEHQQSGASLDHPVELVFRALWEELSLKVETQQFSWERAVEIGPLRYRWNLALQGYENIEHKDKSPFGVLQKAFSPLKAAAKTIDTASAFLGIVTERLEALRGNLDTVREPVRALGRVAQEASKVATAVQSIRMFPHDLASDLFGVANAATTAVFDSWAALPFIDRQSVRSVMIDTLGPMADVRREALTWLGLNFVDFRGTENSAAGSVSYTSTLTPRYASTRPVMPYRLHEGQDVGDLAQDVIGDRTQWASVATANAMADPHATASGRPLGPGETLLVPTPKVSGLQTSGDPADVYGTDLMLGPDGDLVMVGTEDCALVSGVDNLRQALTIRAQTVQGTNTVRPEVGLPATIGDGIYLETAGLLASQARSQFASDPRIEEVTELEVTDEDGDSLRVAALLKPVAGAPFRISAAVSAHGGGA